MAPGIALPQSKLDDHPLKHHQILSKEPMVTITSLSPASEHAPPITTQVLDPSLITQDFDLLRFEAAAHAQLGKNPMEQVPLKNPDVVPSTPASSTSLISSPYNTPGHYLDLTSLPLPSLLFAKALTALKPLRHDYATAEYTSALNLPHVLAELRALAQAEAFTYPATSFYVVTFRSQLRTGIDAEYLHKLDSESHREACESGGLLKYWFGKADGERRNLATCFWHSRADAYKGGLGPWHKKARAAGRELYERIVFSTHRFTILEGATDFTFEEWRE